MLKMNNKDKKNYCTIYLIRHGETDWNVKRIVQGHSDNPLNKTGQLQAKELAKRLKHIHFDAIFSSDLLRAKRTAEIIAQEKKLAVQTTKLLRERAYGKFEGKPAPLLIVWRKAIRKGIEALTAEEKKILIKEDPQIESNESLVSRFLTFVREVAVGYSGKNILIVSHGGLMRIFLIKIGFFESEEQSEQYSIGNTAGVVIETDGVDFFIKDYWGIEKRKPSS
jgi:broad specificity phosphatase PhoE